MKNELTKHYCADVAKAKKKKKDFVILNASVLVKSLTLRRGGFAGSFRLSLGFRCVWPVLSEISNMRRVKGIICYGKPHFRSIESP